MTTEPEMPDAPDAEAEAFGTETPAEADPAERAWDAWYREPHWPGWPDGEPPSEYSEIERYAFFAGWDAAEAYEPEAAPAQLPHYVPGWREAAASAVLKLDQAERVEAKGLADLCMALREGLTREQQRKVATNLLGEPHVSMRLGQPRQPGDEPLTVLVPQSKARAIASFGGALRPDPADPFWGQP